MEDVTNLALTSNATATATFMKDAGYFDDVLTAAKFGMAYAIKYYKDDVDFEEMDKAYTANGNHYNIGSVDPDGYIRKMMSAMYPDCNTPYRYARVLMCYGLDKLQDIIDDGRLFPLSEHM